MNNACCKGCGVKLTTDNDHFMLNVGNGPQPLYSVHFREYNISGYCGECLRSIVDTVMSTATHYTDVDDRNRHLVDVFEEYSTREGEDNVT